MAGIALREMDFLEQGEFDQCWSVYVKRQECTVSVSFRKQPVLPSISGISISTS